MALTGWTNWIERQYLSPLNLPKTFKIAKQSMARVGTISYSDQEFGSINRTCGQGLDATVQVTESKEETLVLIKSRLNETGTTWVGANHREKCIEKIATEMKNSGVSIVKH